MVCGLLTATRRDLPILTIAGDRLLATFETTDYAQMRRCRMAHLHGRPVDEMFEHGACAIGFIQTIRPDLTCWPLRWTITIAQQSAETPALLLQD